MTDAVKPTRRVVDTLTGWATVWSVDFGLLGPLQVSRREHRAEIGGAKQRAVLAHLLIRANQVVSADRLIDEVWGDEPPEAVRKSLHAYVSRLRRALGDEAVIEGRPPGYVLHADPSHIDAARFTALVEEARRLRVTRPEDALELLSKALRLWRGPALDDLADEPSLQGEIARLEELRLAALEERLDVEIALGRATDAIPELERLARDQPLRERVWALLMLALYRAGRQGDALAAYLRARRVLADELGIEPSPELQRLQAQILAQDPALASGIGSLRGYELHERIGAGAFGVVYRATQPGVGREVAIKAIHAHLAQQPEFVRRFEVEAQIVARLEHPRIVPIHDYWRAPDGAFLVMRWLRGGSLDAALEKRVFEPADAARIAEQVAAALAAAHRAGVVHGHVRAGNILLDEDRDAYLTDFGIAIDLAVASGPGRALAAHYLAPEQAKGEPRSPLSDQYSLGIVLHELVAGRQPAPGEFPPGPAAEVIARATAADPAQRYPDVPSLAAAFAAALGRRPAVRLAPVAMVNPYKGLRAFQEADRDDFFGRDPLVDDLVARLAEPGAGQRFLAVVGASGSGKSSLVRAGLVPALRRGGLPGSERWFVAEMYPGSAPFQELDEALLRVAVDAPPTVLDLLTADERGLLRAINRCLPRDGSELVLVVDQLEELFTLVANEALRARFLDSLVTAVAGPDSRLRVVATLRADFYDRPLAHRGMAELLRDRTATVVPLSAEEIGEAVRLPAERAGVEVEPALVGAIVADVVDQPGALPLLQYALTELFERRHDGEMTLAAYRDLGGISGAVARRAEELHAGLDESGRGAVRQLFLRLVALGEGWEETRRRVPLSELQAIEVDRPAIESVIDLFGRHRLLSFDRDPRTREPTVEVAHEALLRAWGRLRAWIEEARDDLRVHRHLAGATADWESGGRDASDLWRGARLEQAEVWAASGSVALTDREHAFIGASAQARDVETAAEAERHRHELELERRSSRRLRALVAVLAVAAFGAAALTGFALSQSREAERAARLATARELAAAANVQLAEDPDLGILLALEAIRTTSEVDGVVLREAEEALHLAVQASRLEFSVPSGGAAFFSSDGTLLAVGGERDTVVVDANSGEEQYRLPGHRDIVFNAVFAPDGTILATNAWDATTRIWDLNSGRERLVLSDPDYEPLSVAISPDGRLLATSIPDAGRVEIRDLESGDLIRALEAIEPVGINFSPDGMLLAAADGRDGLRVWDIGSGEPTLHVPTNPFGLTDVAFSPDGELLVAGGDERVATVWTLAGEPIARLEGHTGNIEGIAFSPDGTRVATGGIDGRAIVWEARTGRPLMTLAGHRTAVINVDFTPDGTRLATGSTDGTTRVWDIAPAGGREWLTVSSHPRVIDASLSPAGDLLATSGMNGEGRIWQVETGDQLAVLPHDGPVRRIEFSPDGSLAATASFDSTAGIWDAATGQLLRSLERPDPIGQATFSPDGTLLATADEGGSVTIWDVASGSRRSSFRVAEGIVADVAWSADGETIAASGFDGSAGMWNVSTPARITAFYGHLGPSAFRAVLQIDVSPDGSLAATASWDGTARIWETSTGDERLRLQGGAELWSVAFSSDGTRLATGGADGAARIWDVATGRELLALRAHAGTVTAVEFSPDGRRLVTASQDQTVRINALAIDDLIELARQKVTRTLTDVECRQYLHLERCPAAIPSPDSS